MKDAQRVRVSNWWLGLLRYMMGLGAGEHVIVLRVYPDGRRAVQVATCTAINETLQ